MKVSPMAAICAVLAFSAVSAPAKEKAAVTLPPKAKFHLFLLAGQSNMAGRGKVSAEDKKIHPRVFALAKDGTWKPAADPIHYDKGAAGVGVGKSFAIALAERDDSISIGLIPAACGGSPISTWEPGKRHGQTRSNPYDDAIKRTHRALQDGVLKGILWHQGESDCNPKSAAQHQKKLTAVIARLRKDLSAPAVPFLIGQLGQFPKRPWNKDRKTVDQAHRAVAASVSAVAFVPSDGLTPKGDNVHFNASSLRTFGKRYAEAFLKVTKP
jgi:hypothetical protein